MFVRAEHWWFNKIPFTFMLLVLLIDQAPVTPPALLAFAAVTLAVCAAANYGYGLNELYDLDEDSRAGRVNAVHLMGRERVRGVVLFSALALVGTAFLAGGWAGLGLGLLELIVPLGYSVPPLRLKERGWWGVAADAAAAHMFPAALALLAIHHFGLSAPSGPVVICILCWSAAVGVRGILSHQIVTADRDARAGLATVAHRLSTVRLAAIVSRFLVPVELVALSSMLMLRGEWLPSLGLAAYLAGEALREILYRRGRPVTGMAPVPLFDEDFYKAWAPMLLALAGAARDADFLIFLAVYGLVFRGHILRAAQREWALAIALGKALPAFR